MLLNCVVLGIHDCVSDGDNHIVVARAILAQCATERCAAVGGDSGDFRAVAKDFHRAAVGL